MLNHNHGEADNLEAIDGIGPKRAKWLRESLNVRTLHELAALTLDTLEPRLKDDKSAPPRRDLEAWIAQAQELTSTAPQPGSHKDDWRPVASFVVEFQVLNHEDGTQSKRTCVSHMEADVNETWAGIDHANLCNWMVEQLGEGGDDVVSEMIEAVLEKPRPSISLSSPAGIPVKITEVQAKKDHLLLGSAKPGQPFLGCIKSHEPFAVHVLFDLAPEFDVRTASCSTHFYAKNIATGATTYLGSTPILSLRDQQAPYRATLTDAYLEAGVYRLNIQTTTETDVPETSYFEVPFLEVV